MKGKRIPIIVIVSPLKNFKVYELINYITYRIGEIICYTANIETNTLFITMKDEYDFDTLAYMKDEYEFGSLTYMIRYYFDKYEEGKEVKISVKGVNDENI